MKIYPALISATALKDTLVTVIRLAMVRFVIQIKVLGTNFSGISLVPNPLPSTIYCYIIVKIFLETVYSMNRNRPVLDRLKNAYPGAGCTKGV